MPVREPARLGARRLPLALFLLLFGLYLLTASGHTYSPDEESLVYVTRSFVTRGEFTIPSPDRYPVVGGHRGLGGKLYSGTGLGPSLITLPLYVAGDQFARAFDPRFHSFLLRLFLVSLFNALVTALTAILFFAWLRRLRLSPRLSLALVLIWALGTLAWPYARTFFSEPLLTLWFVLAAYAVRVYYDTRTLRWMLVGGLAAGFAALTKLQGVLVLPALGLYFLALEFPRDRSPLQLIVRAVRPGALFALGLAACLAVMAYYNFIRFGDVLQSGYGAEPQDYPILTGLYGLLLSSGKSIFLYAPPVLLGLLALPRFARRYAAEALLCVILIATFVVFHARLPIWSGDGAWGPRYLVSTLPFWLLPLGAALTAWWPRAAWRALVVALLGAGLCVNVLALAINFDTYIQLRPNSNARYFRPADSPLLAHWNLLRERAGDWWNELVAAPNGVALVKGFLETTEEDFFPRYLASRALLVVKSTPPAPLELYLLALDYRPAAQEKRALEFYAEGRPLEARRDPAAPPGELRYRVPIPPSSSTTLELVTRGSEPQGNSPMGDELGLHLQALEISRAGTPLPLLRYLAIPPLPTADAKELWAWFYRPTNPQFDFLPWYLYFSGLDETQAMSLAAAFGLGGLMSVAAGLILARRVS